VKVDCIRSQILDQDKNLEAYHKVFLVSRLVVMLGIYDFDIDKVEFQLAW
jgi:hypothetical protein